MSSFNRGRAPKGYRLKVAEVAAEAQLCEPCQDQDVLNPLRKNKDVDCAPKSLHDFARAKQEGNLESRSDTADHPKKASIPADQLLDSCQGLLLAIAHADNCKV